MPQEIATLTPLQGVDTLLDCCCTSRSLVLILAVVVLLLLPDILFYPCDNEKYIKQDALRSVTGLHL